jgi:hypothetical protein
MWWCCPTTSSCSTPEDGTRVVLEEPPKVEGVVQTNVIAVVKPVQH